MNINPLQKDEDGPRGLFWTFDREESISIDVVGVNTNFWGSPLNSTIFYTIKSVVAMEFDKFLPSKSFSYGIKCVIPSKTVHM